MSLVLEFAVRAMLLGAGTAVVLWLLRVRSAAARHAAWLGVIVLMLLLPLWTAWGPRTALRLVPPAAGRTVSRAGAAMRTLAQVDPQPAIAAPLMFQPRPAHLRWSWPTIALGVYLLGVCAMLLRLAIGTLQAVGLRRFTTPGDGVRISNFCKAPVTVGWLHPAVILPADWREWPQGKLRAVLAHEREHARRRDPLTQWLAMLNRALFWFHPLAWWLERRTSALAEEVCDAAAVAECQDPREYSEYLLEFARNVQQSGALVQQWGMAMPGSFLGPRIRRVLSGVPAPRTSRTHLACAAAAFIVAALLCITGKLDTAWAQEAIAVPPGPTFEDVTVQVIPPFRGGDPSSRTWRPPAPGTIHYWSMNLHGLVAYAYGAEEYQVEGGTGTDTERSNIYIITMKAPPRDTPKEQVQEMMQRLLAERFHVALHREQKLVPFYYLTAGPNAMQGLTPEQRGKDSLYGVGPGHYHSQKMELGGLAFALSHSQPRYVLDKTGIRGAYTFNLDWVPDVTEQTRGTLPRSPLFDPSPGHPLSPSLVSALDRLGLKLEPHEDMVSVIVIDRAEEPSGPGPAVPQANSNQILRVERTGRDVVLRWSPEADLIRNATHADLTINDGDRTESYRMDAPQLSSGSLVYSPITADVSFRMELSERDGSTVATEPARLPRAMGRDRAAEPPSPTPAVPQANSNQILRVELRGKDVLLSWSPEADAIRNATHATLTINDGDRTESYSMDAPQLSSGSIVYSPISANVSFRMELRACLEIT